MSDIEKKPYIDLSDKDKDRYVKQLKEMNEKGYFTLESGEKSTDMPPIRKKKKRRKYQIKAKNLLDDWN